jgi:hypothetical protein
LVLCVSEQSLLSVILPAREFGTLASRFQKAVKEHFVVLGASLQDVEREAAAMHQIELGPTVSRSVRGSMRELTFALDDELQRGRFPTREELQRYLSTYIMGAMGMRYPYEVALEVLRNPRKTRRWLEIDHTPVFVWKREVRLNEKERHRRVRVLVGEPGSF